MNRPLAFAAIAEATTGVALIVVPTLVGRLLFGSELPDVSLPVARVAGIALFSLGVACWPGRASTRAMVYGMTVYGALATVYLAYLGVRGWAGPLLWPAVGAHAVLTFLLLRTVQASGGAK
jgi:hypothetical protein